MKNNILNLKLNRSSVWKMMILVLAVSFTACDFEYDLPEANSKADETAPTAYFTYAQGQGTAEEWKDYTFSNLSNSATDYAWDLVTVIHQLIKMVKTPMQVKELLP